MRGAIVPVPPESHFSLQNIPFGVFSPSGTLRRHVGTAIGEHAVSLTTLAASGLLSSPSVPDPAVFSAETLNGFIALGRPAWKETRLRLQQLLSGEDPRLQDDGDLKAEVLFPLEEVTMHLPATIGDYTDFYLSREHATNCGIMFRGPENALAPNWLHLPVAYHGRASSVMVSGTDIHRPRGQVLEDGKPTLAPCKTLDFELEMGLVVGPGNELGHPIPVDQAREHIFGLVLLNDWSARDIQSWEMVPLGPFNRDQHFPLDCDTGGPRAFQDPAVLPYLQANPRDTFDIRLEAALTPASSSTPTAVTETNYKWLYWTPEQMVAHHTITGCNLRPGDLLGTGTISAPGERGPACLLELTWKGSKPITLAGGQKRAFLEDGDTVTFSGYCQGDGYRAGFGACTGRVLPALP